MCTKTRIDYLIPTVNSWGNVQYNIPIRMSKSETRTATSIALRHIPAVPQMLDCHVNAALPERVVGRDSVVNNEIYKTTSSAYCKKASYNKANERSDRGINCRNVIFMTDVQKRLEKKSIQQPTLISEMKEKFQGEILTFEEPKYKSPHEIYIFDFVASGRNEAPCIPESAVGYRKLMDPYLTTHRNYYRPYTINELNGIGAKDHITYYSESPTVKPAKGFGPKHKEIWMPLEAKPDMTRFKAASKRGVTKWIRGVFKTETRKQFVSPYETSRLLALENKEVMDMPNFQPNPYQTNCSPFMYCSEYCHISQRTSPGQVVNQENEFKPKKPCISRFVVSTDCQ